jgi:hypothetical protein
MKVLIFALLFCVPLQQKTVFVCDSFGATKYHYKADCKGLRNCSKDIVEIDLGTAQREKELCAKSVNLQILK